MCSQLCIDRCLGSLTVVTATPLIPRSLRRPPCRTQPLVARENEQCSKEMGNNLYAPTDPYIGSASARRTSLPLAPAPRRTYYARNLRLAARRVTHSHSHAAPSATVICAAAAAFFCWIDAYRRHDLLPAAMLERCCCLPRPPPSSIGGAVRRCPDLLPPTIAAMTPLPPSSAGDPANAARTAVDLVDRWTLPMRPCGSHWCRRLCGSGGEDDGKQNRLAAQRVSGGPCGPTMGLQN